MQDLKFLDVEKLYQISTDSDYKDYLQGVIERAKKTCNSTGVDVNSIQFQKANSGQIIPFGENYKN